MKIKQKNNITKLTSPKKLKHALYKHLVGDQLINYVILVYDS